MSRIVVTSRDRTSPRFGFSYKTWPAVVDYALWLQDITGGEPELQEWPDGFIGLDLERDGKRLRFYKSIAETLKREEHDDAGVID